MAAPLTQAQAASRTQTPKHVNLSSLWTASKIWESVLTASKENAHTGFMGSSVMLEAQLGLASWEAQLMHDDLKSAVGLWAIPVTHRDAAERVLKFARFATLRRFALESLHSLRSRICGSFWRLGSQPQESWPMTRTQVT